MLSTVAPWNVWNHKHYRIQFQFRVKKESSPKVILFYASITNSTRSLSVATSTWCRTKFSSWDKIVNNLMVCSCQDLKIIITQRLIVTLYKSSIGRSRYNYPKRVLNRQLRQGWIRTRGRSIVSYVCSDWEGTQPSLNWGRASRCYCRGNNPIHLRKDGLPITATDKVRSTASRAVRMRRNHCFWYEVWRVKRSVSGIRKYGA